MKRCVLVGALVTACHAAGCNFASRPGQIVRVDLQTTFIAVKPKAGTGPAELPIRVFLYEVSPDRPGEVRAVKARGMLHLLLYKGRVPKSALGTAELIRLESFTPDALPDHLTKTLVGWCYVMRLAVPDTDAVTVVARYRPPTGPPLESEPTTVAIRSR